MTEILEQKAGKLTILDGLYIAGAKLGTETAFSMVPFVGNGTFKSGVIKGVTAVVASMSFKNSKVAQYIATGILIDAMEDLVLATKARLFNKSENAEQGVYVM